MLGVKVYYALISHDPASRDKHLEASIFDFLPHHQLEVLDRAARLGDASRAQGRAARPSRQHRRNPRDSPQISARRAGHRPPRPLLHGSSRPGGVPLFADDDGLFFDSSAVLNPDVHRLALQTFGARRILYGSDNPVFYMRGRRQFQGRTYINRTSYPFFFNRDREPPEVEAKYTLYMYEDLRAMRQACEQLGLDRSGRRSHLPRQRPAADRRWQPMIHDTPIPPPALQLAFKPDAADAERRLRAYWQGELVDRACVSVRAPKDGIDPPRRSLIVAEDFDFAGAIDRFEAWASQMFFGGESMPALMPNYGPDQWAGFLGANLTLVPEKDTSWVEPPSFDWDDAPPLTIDPANRWWKAIVDLTVLAGRRCPGKFILSTIDTHSNLDCLSALRGPERLCIDLVEQPEAVLRALKQVDALYRPVYDTLFEAGRMREFGSTSWSEMWSPRRTQTIQCDFCCMISPPHFRTFALPSLEYEISCLDDAVYHMDGPGQIRHLDDLLAIPNLHTIQWVPGAGRPQAPAWVEMLRKIQKAGKSVQVLVTIDELKAL